MSKHINRLDAPTTWPVAKKTTKWIAKPSPGAHKVDSSIPMAVVLRDMLGYCDTSTEARMIIGARMIKVDGKVVTNAKRGVGLMDVISIPKTGEHFRMMLDTNGKLRLVKITEDKAKWKLARIENKTTVKKGKTQLNLHDGRNIVLANPGHYKTGDTIKIDFEHQKIIETYPFAEGNLAYLIGGQHVGELATVQNYVVTRNPRANTIRFKENFSTVKDNVFIVGINQPEVVLPEVKING